MSNINEPMIRALFLQVDRRIFTLQNKYDRQLFQLEELTRNASSTSTFDVDEWKNNLRESEEGIRKSLVELRSLCEQLRSHYNVQPNLDAANKFASNRNESVLHKYESDFESYRKRGVHALNRLMLLGPRSALALEEGASDTELLIGQNNSLSSSMQTLDTTIHIAATSKAAFIRRKGLFEGISSKLHSVGDKFPVIGNLIGRIEQFQQRDRLIIATVIAVCLFLTFLYIQNK